ncbi:MAG: magnesium transporter CorA family protein [Candidatus Krumholzibacteria bacterium]|nr:magnesium transporter CorA family protein [Candidatus Krumholzibacteria bacterium]
MYDIFKATNDGLIITDEILKDCWVRVANPTSAECEFLSKKLGIPPAFLTDPLDVDERARIETDEGVTLIIVRIPFFDKDNVDIPYTTLPLGIIFTDDCILTVCAKYVETFLDFVSGRVKNFSIESRGRFILQIFFRTALLYLSYLKDINKRTDSIEMELHRSMRNVELIKLLNLEKSLVFFTTSLRSNELMMERIAKTGLRMTEDDKELLDDVIIENRQGIEMANIYSNILSGMMDAFASVINNNLTLVMKFLTSVTIIFMIPTFVSSTFGMNVPLPFQNSPHAFLIVTGISLMLSLTGVWIFWKRRWF